MQHVDVVQMSKMLEKIHLQFEITSSHTETSFKESLRSSLLTNNMTLRVIGFSFVIYDSLENFLYHFFEKTSYWFFKNISYQPRQNISYQLHQNISYQLSLETIISQTQNVYYISESLRFFILSNTMTCRVVHFFSTKAILHDHERVISKVRRSSQSHEKIIKISYQNLTMIKRDGTSLAFMNRIQNCTLTQLHRQFVWEQEQQYIFILRVRQNDESAVFFSFDDTCYEAMSSPHRLD